MPCVCSKLTDAAIGNINKSIIWLWKYGEYFTVATATIHILLNKVERMIPKHFHMPKASAALGNKNVKTLVCYIFPFQSKVYNWVKKYLPPSPTIPLGVYLDMVFASLLFRSQ